MTSVGEVVAQLKAVVERLDRAVVTAGRGQTETGQARDLFAEVGQGSDHRLIRTAVTASSEAAAKSGKAARLLAEAAGHLAAYANVIAPGSAISKDQATDAGPSGERLVSEAERVERGLRGFSRRVAQKAESAGEAGKKLVDFLAESKPSGTASTTQQLPPTPRNPTTAGTPGDAAEALVVTAAAVVAVALKSASLRRKRKEPKRD
ncbi:hypothetical protein [Plantactinospora sp. WMMB782]|uniref:hypothetical protein n=1 Tax=Plantactinospora sp. WMMB782 TaxID=3404121 RepID=UPI003B93AE72